MKKIKWFSVTGSKYSHAFFKTSEYLEIEFHCGIQRHIDDTKLSDRNKCKECLEYIKNYDTKLSDKNIRIYKKFKKEIVW
jgi:hypothetical protein